MGIIGGCPGSVLGLHNFGRWTVSSIDSSSGGEGENNGRGTEVFQKTLVTMVRYCINPGCNAVDTKVVRK